MSVLNVRKPNFLQKYKKKFKLFLVRDVSIDSNMIVANRAKVNTRLTECLTLDVNISNFDLHKPLDLLALCAGKVVYLFQLSSLQLLAKYGRMDGGAHKGKFSQ
jgi:hypothetical protein